MAISFGQVFDDRGTALRGKIVVLLGFLVCLNIVAWGWALLSFQAFPVLLGTAMLAWSFGLRHAVDADHIAAIDNVTRTLMQAGRRPIAVGFFFSLGHSSIVALASIAVAATATAFKDRIAEYHTIGSVVGTCVSAAFLLVIALVNIVILRRIYQAFREVRNGRRLPEEGMEDLLSGGGYLAAILRPAFRLVTRSWHMYPLGVLFGLGFDTATEVGVLGISAAEAAKGMDIWAIMIFPALFAAGMSLIDSVETILMVGAYGWAYANPIRKLYYNMTITSVSVLVALVVGGVEALGLAGDRFGLSGPFWDAIGSLNDNFGNLGLLIVGIVLAAWGISVLIYRVRGYNETERGTQAE